MSKPQALSDSFLVVGDVQMGLTQEETQQMIRSYKVVSADGEQVVLASPPLPIYLAGAFQV